MVIRDLLQLDSQLLQLLTRGFGCGDASGKRRENPNCDDHGWHKQFHVMLPFNPGSVFLFGWTVAADRLINKQIPEHHSWF